MEFTYDFYEKLIKTGFEQNYQFCFYQEADAYEHSIILRHDVDFCPTKALELAKIEQFLGVKSTYFILLSTEFYNVFSYETAQVFHQILDLGHQIGLHFDEQKYQGSSLEQMKDHVKFEADILQRALNTTISVVSMHRPSKFVLDASMEFENLINSYNNKFFKDMKYISDSRMNWRENPFELIQKERHKKIHLLTHPFWYSSQKETMQEKLMQFLNEAKVCRYEMMNKNFKDLHECISKKCLD